MLAGSALLLNIVLNFLLIPSHKAYGAAVSSLITQSYMAIAQVIVTMRKFNFLPDWKLIIRLGTFIGAIFILGWFSRTYLPNWYAGALILAGISFLCAFLIRLLNIKDLYRIIVFEEEK